jgi:hypothetical protein
MIVEVRTYRIKPGLRARFLEFFRNEAIPLQHSIGIQILGPFVDLEDPDVMIWTRAFPSLDERERMKTELYEGDKWIKELEGIAMPMLQRYDCVLTEAPDWFVNDLPPYAQS